ncbi:MAG: WYL domain-containing protein [Lachnospiraceae bacterium]|nr:WYL domain-containing protein [Lachnospiraceae bacterium]
MNTENKKDIQNTDKIERVLYIYSKIMDGGLVSKSELAEQFGVNERSIQRDIDDIRNYMQDNLIQEGYQHSVIYDRERKGYRLEKISLLKLTNSELLALSKILLDSRAFPKDEMQNLLKKIIMCSAPADSQKMIKEQIANEMFHYVEPRHGVDVTDNLWEIGQAIHNNQYIEIKYQGIQGSTVKTRKLKPLAIMFSEYYFYLVAFIDSEKVRENFSVLNDAFPTIYRIDRLQELKVLDEKFYVPYKDRFEEGEFRKRIQFMYGGKLRRVKFKYTGYSVEAVLDRLPTAQIQEKTEDGYIITAEVFGDGIDMWLRSQGNTIEIL